MLYESRTTSAMKSGERRYKVARLVGHVSLAGAVASFAVALLIHGLEVSAAKTEGAAVLVFFWLIVVPVERATEKHARQNTFQEEIVWIAHFLRVNVLPYVFVGACLWMTFTPWVGRTGSRTLRDWVGQSQGQ
jgi:hypothetical protein